MNEFPNIFTSGNIYGNIFNYCSPKTATTYFFFSDPFINRRNANTFISPQQRWRAKAQERWVTKLDEGR